MVEFMIHDEDNKGEIEMIIYVHVRGQTNLDGKPAITLAIRDIGNGFIEYSTAVCSPKDRFVKKIGRELALQNMWVKAHIVSGEIDKNFADCICNVLCDMYSKKTEYPRFIKELLRAEITHRFAWEGIRLMWVLVVISIGLHGAALTVGFAEFDKFENCKNAASFVEMNHRLKAKCFEK